jgi:hypothetical protein
MATDPESKTTEVPLNINLADTPIEEPENGTFMDYANVVNMDWSLYDVRLRFGELMQVLDEASPSWQNQHKVVLEKAAIRIPWHQAKYLCQMLAGVIKNYEEINGELRALKLPAPPPGF